MCFYPRFIKNKRYTGYKLKKGDIPCDDERKLFVPIGCGKCYECKRQKAQQWKVRLMEEIKVQKHAYFVTLTFSDESLKQLYERYNSTDANHIATHATRLFCERWRKAEGKSVRHWLITELGHEGTERLHLHGIIFSDDILDNNTLYERWKYGRTDIGLYCNEQTINYIMKYVTKIDVDHKGYEQIILCSAGLGSSFLDTWQAKNMYRYTKGKSPEYYTLKDGRKVSLPIYYRNKLYSQAERDKMWTERLDRHTIYVNGIACTKLNTIEGENTYKKLLKNMQEWNRNLGYGDTSDEWKTRSYDASLKFLNRQL